MNMNADRDIDPYRPPSSVLTEDQPGPSNQPATGPLYSAGQVGAATFLGSPLAGFWLMRANWDALGDHDKKQQALIWGILSLFAVVLIAVILPENFPSSALTIGYAIGHQKYADSAQGDAFEAHLEAGGEKHSSWRVAGIGLGFMAAIVVVAVGVILLLPA